MVKSSGHGVRSYVFKSLVFLVTGYCLKLLDPSLRLTSSYVNEESNNSYLSSSLPGDLTLCLLESND